MKITKKIIDLVRRRASIDAEIKEYEEAKKEISDKLKEMLAVAGEESMAVDVDGVGFTVALQIRKGTSQVVPERLLELGVDAKVIAEATVKGKDSEPFVTVREVKEKKAKGVYALRV